MTSLARAAVVCLLLSCAAVAVLGDDPLPTCTENDIVRFYTPCVNLTATRTLYEVYKGGCDASNSTALNPPVVDLPCNIDCPPGKYLPYGETDCVTCDAGTFSLGGGARFYHWETQLPHDTYYVMGTYCTNPSTDMGSAKCRGWTSNGAYISTDLEGLSEVEMVLEMIVYLTETGSVGFQYSATSEHEGDLLMFEEVGNTPLVLPMSAEPRYFSTTIDVESPKWVILRWVYYKNPEVSKGEEFAAIDYIEVYGILLSDNKCTPCTPGRYQDEEGKDYCSECEANTYSNDPNGAVTCTECAASEYSYPGASSCTAKDGACDPESDAVAFYTACTDESGEWSRSMYYEWKTPTVCDETGVDLPAPQGGFDCLPCPDGTIHASSGDEECIFCEEGTYSTGSKCEECGAGTAAVLERHFTEWNELPEGFDTTCVGTCDKAGWELYEDFIGTGYPVGTTVDLLLNYEVRMADFGGSLTVEFEMVGDSPFSAFYVLVDGYAASMPYYGSHSTNPRETLEIGISGGHKVISFYFHRHDTEDLKSWTGVKIHSIDVYGLRSDGGASHCTECPVGYYQPDAGESTCLLCPAGTSSTEAGSTGCQACPEDTYNNGSSAGCAACPADTFSREGARYCENYDCIYVTANRTDYFNLSPYAGYEQYAANGDEEFPGWFYVSYCAFLDEDTPCGDNSLVCEVYDKFNPSDPIRDWVSWASEVEFESMEDPHDGFILHYSGGEGVGCENEEARRLHLIFNCDPDSDNRQSLRLVERTGECEATLTTTSIFGCPVCDDDDFEAVESECENDQMDVKYEKKDGARCNGMKQSTVDTCGELELNVGLVIGISVAVVACVIFLAAGLVLIFLKNRRLQTKYSLLQSQYAGEGEEMEEVEVPEADKE